MLIEQGIIIYIASLNPNTPLNASKQGDLIAGLIECKISDP